MNRKLYVSIVSTLTAAVLFVTPVLAASSSTTTNTTVSSSSSSSTAAVVAVPDYIVEKTGVAARTADGVRVTADYSGVTEKAAIATIVAPTAKAPADSYAQALSAYVAASGQTYAKTFGPYKVRMYKAGVSVWDGFGTFSQRIGVGIAYEGRTATVFIIGKDGSVTTTTAVVKNGKVAVSMTTMGTIEVAIQ